MRKRLTAGVLLSCCACQAYTPISVTPATAAQDVRVNLNEAGMAASFGRLGSGAASMEGRLQNVNDSTLSLAVTQVTLSGGDDEARSSESVTIPRSQIASVERRQTSVPRSLVAAGAVIGGAFLVARALGNGDQTGSARGGGGPPTQK